MSFVDNKTLKKFPFLKFSIFTEPKRIFNIFPSKETSWLSTTQIRNLMRIKYFVHPWEEEILIFESWSFPEVKAVIVWSILIVLFYNPKMKKRSQRAHSRKSCNCTDCPQPYDLKSIFKNLSAMTRLLFSSFSSAVSTTTIGHRFPPNFFLWAWEFFVLFHFALSFVQTSNHFINASIRIALPSTTIANTFYLSTSSTLQS